MSNQLKNNITSSHNLFENGTINLFEIYRIIKYRRFFVLMVVFLFTLLSALIAYNINPIYKSEILLLPINSKMSNPGLLGGLGSSFTGLAGIAGFDVSNNISVEASIATLTSHKFITQFIKENNAIKNLFSDLWDEENSVWVQKKSLIGELKELVIQNNSSALNSFEPTDWQIYNRFSEILDAKLDPVTGLVSVSIEWTDPKLASEWVNLLVARFNREMKNQTIVESELKISFLKEQLEKTSISDLKAVLWRLVEENIKSVTLAKTTNEFAFKVIDPAVPADLPFKPKKLMFIVVGLICGVVVGISSSLMIYFFHKFKE